VNRGIQAAAGNQGAIHRVDDRVNPHPGDVVSDDFKWHLHTSGYTYAFHNASSMIKK
jgi:hypothetical protein